LIEVLKPPALRGLFEIMEEIMTCTDCEVKQEFLSKKNWEIVELRAAVRNLQAEIKMIRESKKGVGGIDWSLIDAAMQIRFQAKGDQAKGDQAKIDSLIEAVKILYRHCWKLTSDEFNRVHELVDPIVELERCE
jgi:hypothetical protein